MIQQNPLCYPDILCWQSIAIRKLIAVTAILAQYCGARPRRLRALDIWISNRWSPWMGESRIRWPSRSEWAQFTGGPDFQCKLVVTPKYAACANTLGSIRQLQLRTWKNKDFWSIVWSRITRHMTKCVNYSSEEKIIFVDFYESAVAVENRANNQLRTSQ